MECNSQEIIERVCSKEKYKETIKREKIGILNTFTYFSFRFLLGLRVCNNIIWESLSAF